MKKNNGITLIALVVTIIVLLILAGVSLAMLTGESGILGRASEASYQTKLSEAAEYINYQVTEGLAKHYADSYAGAGAEDDYKTVMKTINKAITDCTTTVEGTVVCKGNPDVAMNITGVNYTAAAAGTPEALSGSIVLTYGDHTKTGTVTSTGIVWTAVN